MSSLSNQPLTLSIGAETELYATCGSGLEQLLAEELKALGLSGVQTAGAGVRFRGGLEAGYKACLWSRIANRVVVPVHEGEAATPERLYALVQEIDWSSHMDVDGTLAVDFFTAKSAITHSQYGALKVKDAIVDQFRESQGRRPNVERETPDLRINVYLFRDKARIAIDLSGSSLHRRGYRDAQGLAPLKENLAAALLLASGWPDAVRKGLSLVDPMCGSGTLLIEAALMACQIAPGLYRDYFGFQGWKGHDQQLWETLLADARAARCESPVVIAGTDNDPQAIQNCRQNVERADLQGVISVQPQSLSTGRPAALARSVAGFVISNPPYGERLAADSAVYKAMGTDLSRHYAGWQCALFTAEAAPYARMRLPLKPSMHVRNGGIDCVLLLGEIPGRLSQNTAESAMDSELPPIDETGQSAESVSSAVHPQSVLYRGPRSVEPLVVSGSESGVDVAAFTNRVKKNQRALKGWVRQNAISAYRVYDSDLPEFAVAIDLYEGSERHCVVQEYQAPATVNQAMAVARLDAIMAALPAILDLPASSLHLKVREVQTGSNQYQKQDGHGPSAIFTVHEFGSQLEVNASDYLDTGLFLDHRPVRRYVWQNSLDKRFLNLFAYTATATVAAVAGGALSSVSVDTSNRYCQWAMRNLDRNQAAPQRHEVVRQEALTWLEGAVAGSGGKTLFDLILLDPPTFSNSGSLETDWNIQRDHARAIELCLKLLSPGGTLIFSTNFRRFKLDASLQTDPGRGITIEERSRWSIDRDFQRNPRIHQCWFIRKESA